jgi:hypothetical protein
LVLIGGSPLWASLDYQFIWAGFDRIHIPMSPTDDNTTVTNIFNELLKDFSLNRTCECGGQENYSCSHGKEALCSNPAEWLVTEGHFGKKKSIREDYEPYDYVLCGSCATYRKNNYEGNLFAMVPLDSSFKKGL